MAASIPDPANAERHSTASVYAQIRSRVLRHEIPPNTHINIDALARELQVSPTPIREALKQLQGDNLVVQERGRGYRTTPILEFEELRALFEFRMLVEPWAARVASQDRLSNPGRNLTLQIEELTSLMSVQADVRYELMDHDIRFHDTILESTSNEVLRGAYAQTHCHLHAFRLRANDETGRFTVQEHVVISDAIRRRDPDAAEQAMRDHLAAAYLRFEQRDEVDGGLLPSPDVMLPGLHTDRPLVSPTLAL